MAISPKVLLPFDLTYSWCYYQRQVNPYVKDFRPNLTGGNVSMLMIKNTLNFARVRACDPIGTYFHCVCGPNICFEIRDGEQEI